MDWRRWTTVAGGAKCRLATALLAAMALLPAPAAYAEDSVPLPFVEGEAVRVIQGYNGGTHQGPSVYGLDLVLGNGETSGAPVISPLDGTIAFAFEPGASTGCVSVLGRDGRFGVMLCHVLLDRPYKRGEKIARGQSLGVVGAPGTVGNNGTSHVHMELLRGGRSGNPVPFGAPDGLPLGGVDLPASGAPNEHASAAIISTNAVAPPPVASQSLAPPTSTTGRQPAPANRCAPSTTPRYVLGFAELSVQLGDTMGSPVTCEFPDPNGTGDVLQQTTKGLAFWRRNTNTPTFTNGFEHWGRTSQGWMYWTGNSIDPLSQA